MPDYSMHNAVPEKPRTCEEPGFNNVGSPGSTTMPATPFHKPAPLENAVNPSSDTTLTDVPPGTPRGV